MSHFLPDWLQRRATLHPGRPALLAGGHSFSFSALDAAASALAERLRELGAAGGAPLALLAGNVPAFVAAIHAAPRSGAVLAPLNARLSPAELAWQLQDLGAALLLHDEAHAAQAAAAGVGLPLQLVRLEDGAGFGGQARPAPRIDLDALHTIVYTSGTTGSPKGATLTYGNHWWSATASALNLGLRDDDRWLAALPLFHVGGLSILMRGAIYGIPVLLHERFDPAAVNRAIDEEHVTIVSVVATMLQRMLDERGARPYPPHLRCLLLGGGPAPLPLLERCAALGAPVVQTYGMTETASQAVTLAPADALRKLGSAGKPLLPLELRVVAEDREAAPGEVGEIQLRGPMVTPGYRGQPAATAAALADGWLRTGDLGYLDSEGYLYVVDRRTDLIISGGENVYPAEVEAALMAHPHVREAGVVGLPDLEWGQVPVAFVVPAPGAGPGLVAELAAFARGRLASYKAPHHVTLVDELPRTAAGKLRRNRLREWAAGERP